MATNRELPLKVKVEPVFSSDASAVELTDNEDDNYLMHSIQIKSRRGTGVAVGLYDETNDETPSQLLVCTKPDINSADLVAKSGGPNHLRWEDSERLKEVNQVRMFKVQPGKYSVVAEQGNSIMVDNLRSQRTDVQCLDNPGQADDCEDFRHSIVPFDPGNLPQSNLGLTNEDIETVHSLLCSFKADDQGTVASDTTDDTTYQSNNHLIGVSTSAKQLKVGMVSGRKPDVGNAGRILRSANQLSKELVAVDSGRKLNAPKTKIPKMTLVDRSSDFTVIKTSAQMTLLCKEKHGYTGQERIASISANRGYSVADTSGDKSGQSDTILLIPTANTVTQSTETVTGITSMPKDQSSHFGQKKSATIPVILGTVHAQTSGAQTGQSNSNTILCTPATSTAVPLTKTGAETTLLPEVQTAHLTEKNVLESKKLQIVSSFAKVLDPCTSTSDRKRASQSQRTSSMKRTIRIVRQSEDYVGADVMDWDEVEKNMDSMDDDGDEDYVPMDESDHSLTDAEMSDCPRDRDVIASAASDDGDVKYKPEKASVSVSSDTLDKEFVSSQQNIKTENSLAEGSTSPKKENKVLNCLCGETFSDEPQFLRHFEYCFSMNEGKKGKRRRYRPGPSRFIFRCETCQGTFDRLDVFRAHVCQILPDSAENSSASVHLEQSKVSTVNAYLSGVRRKYFLTKRTLRCSELQCGDTFSRSESLKLHMKRCHGVKRLLLPKGRKDTSASDVGTLDAPTSKSLYRKPYQCLLCVYKCMKMSALLGHVNDVHCGKMFYCNVCKKSYRRWWMLKKHMAYNHLNKCRADESPLHNDENTGQGKSGCLEIQVDPLSVKKSICNVCGKPFTTDSSYKQHLLMHAMPRIFKCTLCPLSFQKKQSMYSHILTHLKDNPNLEVPDSVKNFICPTCGKVSFFRSKHQEHLSSHKQPFLCPICGRKFKRKRFMEIHIQRHSENHGQFRCSTCGKSFLRKGFLDRHTMSHTGINAFQCSLCPKKFYSKLCLYHHTRRHKIKKQNLKEDSRKERPKLFLCELCGKECAISGALERHMMEHTRPFMCTQCPKRFGRKETLEKHEVIHARQRFACKVCNKQYKSEGILQRHLRKHEVIRKCDYCERTFTTKQALERHTRTHTGERPYTCEQCAKSYKRQDAFVKHLREHC